MDVSGVPPHRHNVSTVFQTYALFPFLSVFDNVAFGLKHRSAGGQQQRVALARALVLNPRGRHGWTR